MAIEEIDDGEVIPLRTTGNPVDPNAHPSMPAVDTPPKGDGDAPAAQPDPDHPSEWRDEQFLVGGIGTWRRRLGERLVDQRHALRMRRLTTPAPRGGRRIAVLSAKGGVGKTTTTFMVGEALARHRGDRICAMDCNPDAGSLAMRLPKVSTDRSVADLVRDATSLRRYADAQDYVSQTASRLSVLASSLDPDVSRELGPEEYRTALAVLAYHWSVVICDLGTGLTDAPTAALIGGVDQYVIVTGPQLDEGKIADRTLNWLGKHFPHKAARSVVVVNRVGRGRTQVDPNKIAGYFAERVRSVVQIPWDKELATGGAPRWDRLSDGTRDAYLDLAAAVADDFARSPATTGDARTSSAVLLDPTGENGALHAVGDASIHNNNDGGG